MLKEDEEDARKLKLGDLEGTEGVLDQLDWKVDLLGFTEAQQSFFNVHSLLLRAILSYLQVAEVQHTIVDKLNAALKKD